MAGCTAVAPGHGWRRAAVAALLTMRFPVKLHHRGHPAVDEQDMSVDERGRIAGEEDRRTLQLLDLAPTAGGRARADPGGELLVRHQRLIELGAEITRRDAVRRDAVLGELRAHRLGEIFHRALPSRSW